MSKTSNAYGLTDKFWTSLDDKSRALYDDVRPLRSASYVVQYPIYRIEQVLEEIHEDAQGQGGELDLNPDFQRGHVWNQDKQIAFVEAIMRGTAPMVIRFNSPGWNGKEQRGDLNPYDVLCVDGLQRITAMREFMAGKFQVFGKYSVDDLEETPFSFKRIGMNWTLEMFDIPNRADLLQFYLDLNAGGVVHSAEELERVGDLLEKAKNKPEQEKPKKPSP